MYATVAEVFALNNLIVALQLYLAARAWSDKNIRFVYATAFAVGLGLSNHLTSGVAGAVVLSGLLWHTRKWWRELAPALGLVAALLAGLLPYVMMPIASASAIPSPAQWGDQSTLTGFLNHVLRREYGPFRLGGSSFDRKIGTLEQLAFYGRDALRQLVWVGVPLAAWGVYRGVQDRRTRPAVVLSALSYAIFLVAFHSLANLPLDQPLFHGIVARFWQQPNLFASACAGIGLASLPAGTRRLVVPTVFLLVGCQIGLNWRATDQHRGWTFYDYGVSILRPLPEGTLLLTHGDLILNVARYMQSEEGVRPDVRILDQEMLTYRWMTGHVQRLMPDVTIPGTPIT